MAQKVEVKYLSDLNPETEAQETVNFGLDGTGYEIDLTSKEAAAMRKSLGKYVEASRKVTAKKQTATKRPSSNGSGPPAKDVREWARSQGFKVTDRGRIPSDVVEKYKEAH